MSEFRKLEMDPLALDLEFHVKVNQEIERLERKKRTKQQVKAFEQIASALSRADIPAECDVKYTYSLYGYLHINVYNLWDFSDIAEVLEAINSLVPKYWQDPEPSFDSADKCKTWSFYCGTNLEPIAGIFLKGYVDPESTSCKIITETIEYTVPASIQTEQRTEVVCPGDPRYYEV